MAKTFSLARFGSDAKGVVAGAQKRADQLRHKHATSLHLLMDLLDRVAVVGDALASIDVNADELRTKVADALGQVAADGDGRSFLSSEMIELLRRAETEAGSQEVDVGDVVNALAQIAEGPTRVVLASSGVKPGAFRSFFIEPDDAPSDEDEGEAMLRDFASQVRTELRGKDERALRERGATLIARLADQLSGRDGIPGLRVVRVHETRIQLKRPPREGEVSVAFENDSGAVALHRRKDQSKSLTRYLWNPSEKRWASIEGEGLYADLRGAISACLFPEMG